MTTDLLPKRQRPLCQECQANAYGSPERYTFRDWPAGTCRRSRKYHRRQALLRQPGTTTYRDGKAARDVPLPDEEQQAGGPA
jgi:hypothetical protein